MGLIKAALGSVGGVLADQWKEYIYCDSMPENVLAVKGKKRVSGRSSNTRGSENVISNGSVIAVNDGQCMIIVDQGKIVELCAEPGEFTYDYSTEPSIFTGELGDSVKATFQNIGKRIAFGGEAPKDQRVYFINTKELMGNKYGTASPVPFRVVDHNVGLDVDISIRCFGEFSYRICDPMLFYTNVCSNVTADFTRDRLDGQLRTELMTALQPAFGKISEMGIRYSSLPAHTLEIADALNEVLSAKWRKLRGLEVVSFGVTSVKASEEDEKMIKDLQRTAAFANERLAQANRNAAAADAMRSAASNEGGAMLGFMNMGMAAQMAGNMFGQQPQYQQPAPSPAPAPAADSWTCSCGHVVAGKFCPECGSKKPEPKSADSWVCACGHTASGKFCPECGAKKPAPKADGWTCICGAVNKGKFCPECGAKKPVGAPVYKCDKCGWEPKDPAHPPKFCPECGDPFDESDLT